jgi:acyl-CoA dehydrogenase
MDSFDTPVRRELRELTRRFVTREVLPHLDAWERAGEVPRSLHVTAAKLGLLGVGFPEAVGGSGGDPVDPLVVTEEIIQSGGSSGLVVALFTHGIALPALVAGGGPALVDAYVRPTLAGEKIGALASTEPAPTWRRSARRRSATATRTWSTAARRSSPVARGPTS